MGNIDPEVIDDIFFRTKRQGDCIVWQGAKIKGYGSVRMKKKHYYVHRLVLEFYEGPSDLDASHVCNNPACCNPEHLVWESRKANMHRHPDYNDQQYPCGHPRTEENTYTVNPSDRKGNTTICRNCHMAKARRARSRK